MTSSCMCSDVHEVCRSNDFCSSENGLSHNAEFTSQREIEDGSNVMLQIMAKLSGLHD